MTHMNNLQKIRKALSYCILLILLNLIILISGCQRISTFFTLSPPGWEYPVYKLMLSNENFPKGWENDFDYPENVKDQITNHVAREWRHKTGAGLVIQSIWRSKTIKGAEKRFDELKSSRYNPSAEWLNSEIVITDYIETDELVFQSEEAEEFYVACGWREYARCVSIFRYHNYVILLNSELSGDLLGINQSKGLTYTEINNLMCSIDNIMTDFLKNTK